jgi:hypothetical protein
MKKYVRKNRKIRVILVTKNKVDVPYLKISYILDWSWYLISVSNQSFKYNKYFKSLICWNILYVLRMCTRVRRAYLDVSKLLICWSRTFNNTHVWHANMLHTDTFKHEHLFIFIFTHTCRCVWHVYHYPIYPLFV